MKAFFAAIKAAYNKVVAHLTKIIAGAGAAIMMLDPEAIQNSAAMYLSLSPVIQRRVGMGLFVLVGVRGWYVGRKMKALQAQLAAMKPPVPPA